MKRWKGIIILGLLVLVIGGSLALAQEQSEETLTLRERILQILQEHPEVWEEIQSSREFDDEKELNGTRGWGMGQRPMARGRMMNRNHMGFCVQEGYGPMMGPRWNR